MCVTTTRDELPSLETSFNALISQRSPEKTCIQNGDTIRLPDRGGKRLLVKGKETANFASSSQTDIPLNRSLRRARSHKDN